MMLCRNSSVSLSIAWRSGSSQSGNVLGSGANVFRLRSCSHCMPKLSTRAVGARILAATGVPACPGSGAVAFSRPGRAVRRPACCSTGSTTAGWPADNRPADAASALSGRSSSSTRKRNLGEHRTAWKADLHGRLPFVPLAFELLDQLGEAFHFLGGGGPAIGPAGEGLEDGPGPLLFVELGRAVEDFRLEFGPGIRRADQFEPVDVQGPFLVLLVKLVEEIARPPRCSPGVSRTATS